MKNKAILVLLLATISISFSSCLFRFPERHEYRKTREEHHDNGRHEGREKHKEHEDNGRHEGHGDHD
ncbi:MAG: hypothetical protein WCG87_04685 [Bacteroidota bacterium]